jgi:hypothetical protein
VGGRFVGVVGLLLWVSGGCDLCLFVCLLLLFVVNVSWLDVRIFLFCVWCGIPWWLVRLHTDYDCF